MVAVKSLNKETNKLLPSEGEIENFRKIVPYFLSLSSKIVWITKQTR